jgi:3-dehydroquinate dehydratase-1
MTAVTTRPITVRGKPIAGGAAPVICTPLVGRTALALENELEAIVPKRPDVLEWRVDYFQELGNTPRVIEAGRLVRERARDIPILFTRRAAFEGGEAIGIGEDKLLEVYEAMCASGCIDLIDYELAHPAANRERVRASSKRHGVGLVLSYHNFKATPSRDELVAKIVQAAQEGADVAKVAVMPISLDDVLVLLDATLQASRRIEVPMITMAMGPLGSLTRMVGGVFGAALTFAVGQSASAPGQVPIEDLRTVLGVVRRVTGMQA